MAEMSGNIGTVTVSVEIDMKASEQFDAIAKMLGYAKADVEEDTCDMEMVKHYEEQSVSVFKCSKCGGEYFTVRDDYIFDNCPHCKRPVREVK